MDRKKIEAMFNEFCIEIDNLTEKQCIELRNSFKSMPSNDFYSLPDGLKLIDLSDLTNSCYKSSEHFDYDVFFEKNTNINENVYNPVIQTVVQKSSINENLMALAA